MEEGRQRELAAYAEELIKEFPEITLRSWCFSHQYKGGVKQDPGVILNLTGPEIAVRAFLASLGLARNLDSIQVLQDIDPGTGRISNKPVKDFRAYLIPWKMD